MTTQSAQPTPAGAKPSLRTVLTLLALVVAAGCALRLARVVSMHGSTGDLGGRRLVFSLGLYAAVAAVGAWRPAIRFRLLLGASIAQILILYGPLEGVGALAIWIAFFHVVHSPLPWSVRLSAIGGLYAMLIVAGIYARGSTLLGVLTVVFFSCNFALRSALYVYEAAFKKEQLGEPSLDRFLVYLTALPLGVFSLSPIGFAALHRGYRSEGDTAQFRKGVGEIALGFAFLAVRGLAQKAGLVPSFYEILPYASELNSLTAFAAIHILALNLYLENAGYIHISIGQLRTLGFDIAPGMERPYQATNVLEFWRRWNTYWRDYLMTLVYYPIANTLRRRPYLAVTVAGAATFVFAGFTHASKYFLSHPHEFTMVAFAQAHLSTAVLGFFVTIWMLLYVRRRRKARGPLRAGPPTWGARAFGFVSIVATITLTAAILALFARPFGIPEPHALELARAFLRPPAW